MAYRLVCAGLGLALGWLPWLLHGPIAYKFNVLFMHGNTAVWAFYSARLLIGALVGMTNWPHRWYVRGPLCGLMMMGPVGLIALATPNCGFT
jgi:hypothetical protein